MLDNQTTIEVAISVSSIDSSSFSKALFGSDVEGQLFLSTMKALPLSKCPFNSNATVIISQKKSPKTVGGKI